MIHAGFTSGPRCVHDPRPGLGMVIAEPLSFPLPALDRAWRVAHLTDLHLPDPEAEAAVELALRFHPHVVALTGDFVGYGRRALPALTQLLRSIPVPMVAVLGNHDHWAGVGHVVGALEAAGVQVLRNGRVEIEGLDIVGVDDGVTGHDDLDAAFAGLASAPLVLSHDPRLAPAIWERGGAVVLSGHTHGGHVDMGRLTDQLFRHPYLAGVTREARGVVYTCPGIGGATFRARAGKRSRRTVGWIELTNS